MCEGGEGGLIMALETLHEMAKPWIHQFFGMKIMMQVFRWLSNKVIKYVNVVAMASRFWKISHTLVA